MFILIMSVLVKTYMSFTYGEKFIYKMMGGLDDPQWALHFLASGDFTSKALWLLALLLRVF